MTTKTHTVKFYFKRKINKILRKKKIIIKNYCLYYKGCIISDFKCPFLIMKSLKCL